MAPVLVVNEAEDNHRWEPSKKRFQVIEQVFR